ncbi:L-dopachrome tautomerase yellow-f-like [Wyeomyia smithii]|uniref:L-dopachrome tautomerase yellow-f-like n=1 Tax=Wyeomyia smithii TaxID=174621 RepID=UPI0024680D7C|nr:L-dopachrome tautomerase yellow-f-like [Wyeomyia smithii]XP_055537162.1 L-dopachrome tautomerase yellow-f-like [Wyeomyia smithii]XP_055537172.1 L-dopachrome tautomerase yellow-f-like [Wyeomyia smithii]
MAHIWTTIVTVALMLPVVYCQKIQEVFHWKRITHQKDFNADTRDIFFEELNPTSLNNETFASYVNVPMGVTHHKGRLFITVPRRFPGVPSTLNVIDIATIPEGEMSPPLKAYPDYIVNQLHSDYHPDQKRFISIYRSKVDRCDRLWFVDTGMLEYPGNATQVQRPQVWIIDLLRDRKVRSFPIPETIVWTGEGMASLVVDVDTENCDKAFAYIPDLVQAAIYVYSFEANRMWAFRHSSFQQNPQRANFHVAGLRFVWDDGIFSITLGRRDPLTKARPVYYHPMVSTSEFTTSSLTLQNESLASTENYGQFFQLLGDRGPNSQSTLHHYDEETGVIFYAEVNRNAIGCWNSKNNFTAEDHDTILLDHADLIYPGDLNADADGVIWVLANNLPTWLYSRYDENRYNFHVWRIVPKEAIIGTKCHN